jgi:hypothetical protein
MTKIASLMKTGYSLIKASGCLIIETGSGLSVVKGTWRQKDDIAAMDNPNATVTQAMNLNKRTAPN